MFSLKTGDVVALNIHSNYLPIERKFTIVDRSAIPLRLTRNITDFLFTKPHDITKCKVEFKSLKSLL